MFSSLTHGVGSVLSGGSANPEQWFYQLIGFAVMTVSIIMTNSAAWYFRRGMTSGRLEYAIASPTNPIVFVAANSLANALAALIALVFAGIVGTLTVYGVGKLLNLMLALALMFVALLPVVGINLMVGTLTMVLKEPEPVANMVTSIVAATSGFAYPLTLLPQALQIIGQILPFHHVVETARTAITAAITPLQIIILFLMMIYLFAGLTIYRYGEENYARKTGVSW